MTSWEKAKESLLKGIAADLEIQRGFPLPLGATLKRNGINFAIFSRHATSVTLVIFVSGVNDPIIEFPLDPRCNRTGHIWHAFIRNLNPGIRYGYRVDRQFLSDQIVSDYKDINPAIHRFDPSIILVDPYAKALSGGSNWGEVYHRKAYSISSFKGGIRRSLVVDDNFDWGSDHPLNAHLADSIIYELHVRGFTRHVSSNVQNPGTFAGLIEKIPYLKELGVTAIELLPINEFQETDTNRVNPLTGARLLNFWGYHSLSFFAPKASYASDSRNGGQVKEFKTMVKAMHEAGIEVILDMVFNHTAEGDERGPTFCFRGFDNSIYYMLDPQTGTYYNYSGCGNTMNCNHPVVRNMILDCLRYWVTEMHVDGFRFDLASILGRGENGEVLSNPPILESIAGDPVLANTKLIAEAWDAAGLYQVGTFPSFGRWAEWNGKFRDDVRRFIKSDPGMVPALATRLVGSPDLYQGNGRAPYHSINFVTSHDGFTLMDLVSYNEKYNEANGENNTDGMNENFSWNCGWEGPTFSPPLSETEVRQINTLRLRQVKNLATFLLFSQGVPMILAGDEFGRTQQGNNNAYCQDNEVSWINWELTKTHAELFRFFKLLIAFRKKHPILRLRNFIENNASHSGAITWHGVKLNQPDWSWDSRSLAMHLKKEQEEDIFLIANAHWESHLFELPWLGIRRRWCRVIDTFLESPFDITEEGTESNLRHQNFYKVGPRTVVVLISKWWSE